MFDWISRNDEWLAALGFGSAAAFIISLILVPLVIIYLPKDFFSRPEADSKALKSPLRLILYLLRNLLGVLLILAGLLMLVLPGQGILTILLGLALLRFPGKRRLEIKIIRNRRVRGTVQWIRRKAGKLPLEIPEPIVKGGVRR